MLKGCEMSKHAGQSDELLQDSAVPLGSSKLLSLSVLFGFSYQEFYFIFCSLSPLSSLYFQKPTVASTLVNMVWTKSELKPEGNQRKNNWHRWLNRHPINRVLLGLIGFWRL